MSVNKRPEHVPTTLNEILEMAHKHGVVPNGFIYHPLDPAKYQRCYIDPDEFKRDEPTLEEVQLCRAWIRTQKLTKKIQPANGTSYGYKHRVENDCGVYISNGAFIVAAYLERVKVRRLDIDRKVTPNAVFNIGRSRQK